MKAPGRILLVATYELGHQPLSLAWPAAVLERHGYAPAVMDLSVAPFDGEKVKAADIVCVSVPMHTALRLGVAAAERIRATHPAAHICFYGLYASLNADYLLGRVADSVIGGEVEAPLLDLIGALDAGDDRTPPGVQRQGHVARPHLERLRFPVPSRGALPPLQAYARLARDGRRELVGYVEATRGCKHLCRHCPIPPVYGGRFFAVPLAVCLADIRQCVEAGATHITFGDPDFLNGPRHALELARALHAEFPSLTFDVTAKVEHLLKHRQMLPELAASGCVFIVSAVESLSDLVLTHLHKGHTRADVTEALRAVRRAGTALRPTWVAFTPWTTLSDYREMLDFIGREQLVDHVDPVQYSIRLLVPPGSLLLESAALRPHLGDLVAEHFYYTWTHPDPRMDQLQREVGSLVAAAADRDEDPAITYDRVRNLAERAAGVEPSTGLAPALAPDRARPPHLTEPWFC